MATKHCSKCGVEKSTAEFSPSNCNRDGLKGQCKDCRRAYEDVRHQKKREPAPTKTCTVCRVEMPSACFPRHKRMADGLNPWCKECSRRKSAEARAKWTPEQLEASRARARRNAKTPVGRENQKRAREKAAKSGKTRVYQAAFTAVVFAVYHGKLTRAFTCQGSGEPNPNCQVSPTQPHHHKGYARENWLDVVWLCKSCHRIADRRRKKEEDV